MSFIEEVDIHDADLNRIANGMDIDMSNFDAVLDFSVMESLSMITKLAKNNFDMKNLKQSSALKLRAKEINATYTSYDDMLEPLCDKVYIKLK